MKWWHIAGLVAVLGGGVWLGKLLLTAAPGTKMEDQGREHVRSEQVADYSYNSNPPTSGPHLPIWVKAGVYDRPLSEGELLHSLEHGYVIISYNCNVHLSNEKGKMKNVKFNRIEAVYAHEEEGSASADFVDPTIATGSAVNETDGCKALVAQLTELANRKRVWKLVVVPRPQLDTTIALTAWNYIDKFDPPAGGFDAQRLERFIDYHRDHGPEQTMD